MNPFKKYSVARFAMTKPLLPILVIGGASNAWAAEFPTYELVADALSLGEEYILQALEGYRRVGAGMLARAPMTGPKGESYVVVGFGTFPPFAKEGMPLRIMEIDEHGIASDKTAELFKGSLALFEHPRHIVFADFNEDGADDIYVAAHGYDVFPFPGEPNGLLLSQPDGTYLNVSHRLPSETSFTHSATVGDVNGDGHLDIFAGNLPSGELTTPVFLLGDGTGQFQRNTAWLPTDDPSWPEFTTFERAFDTARLIDVDNSGYDDLVLGSRGDGATLLFINDGTGDFSVTPALTLPDGLFGQDSLFNAFEVYDLNQDGYDDLIATQTIDYAGWAIQILINTGANGFRDETATRMLGPAQNRSGNWITFTPLVDVNQDGLVDFYIEGTPEPDTDPVMWINNGNGSFSPRTWRQIGLAAAPENFVMTDFSKGGYSDIVSLYHFGAAGIVWDSYVGGASHPIILKSDFEHRSPGVR